MSNFFKINRKAKSKPGAAPLSSTSVQPNQTENHIDKAPFVKIDPADRSIFDENGYPIDINMPIDPASDLNQEILKYRSADGQYQFSAALYANFPDLKENFEENREDVADIICDLFLLDESYAYKIWKWLLITFRSVLSSPSNSYRLISGVLYTLAHQYTFFEHLLPFLRSDMEFSEILFRESAYVDKRHALILASCIEKQDCSLFQELVVFLKSNPHLGHENAIAFEKILQIVLEEIPSPAVDHGIYSILSDCIKTSAKPMMRKILLKILDGKLEYLLKEEARKKAEKKRLKRIEEQNLLHQKEIASRLNLRNTKLKYHELKLACLSQRKNDPYWENGRFIDFQALAGTMIALKDHTEVLASLLPGDRVGLVREPYNAKDPASISVHDGTGVKLGYISNQANTLLSFIIDHGEYLFGRIYSLGRETDSDIIQICIEIFIKNAILFLSILVSNTNIVSLPVPSER